MPSAKHRILFLITTSDWGGAQLFVHQMAREAMRAGYQVLVAAGGEGELETRCKESSIPYHQLQKIRREISPLHDLAAMQEIRTLIRAYAPDVVHLNSSKMGVLGSIAADLERVPRTIYRIGGWAFLENIPLANRLMYLWAEKLTASRKDVIVTVHPDDEALAKKERIIPRRALMTIPNGLDLELFDRTLRTRIDARRELGIADHEFVIGTIANFYPAKNLPWFLDVIASITQEHPELRVIIFGDGPEREAISRTSTNLHLEKIVRLPGRRADAATLLHAFDLFVLPSSKEGMPWSLLEAMAAGLPCIASDVGACRWMLSPDAGLLVPPMNKKKLRPAIHDLLNDAAQRTHLGTHARRMVEDRFRWETTVQKTLQLFR